METIEVLEREQAPDHPRAVSKPARSRAINIAVQSEQARRHARAEAEFRSQLGLDVPAAVAAVAAVTDNEIIDRAIRVANGVERDRRRAARKRQRQARRHTR